MQIEHQLMVTKAALADVFVFDGAEGLLLEVVPDASTWPRIHEAWDRFATLIASKSAPPLSKGDVRERSDSDWNAAAAHYVEVKLFTEQAQMALAQAKDRLVALASHTSEAGGGVTVTRYWKQGAIEYKKIAELKALDLEQYRGAPREETRVTANT